MKSQQQIEDAVAALHRAIPMATINAARFALEWALGLDTEAAHHLQEVIDTAPKRCPKCHGLCAAGVMADCDECHGEPKGVKL